MNSTELNGNIEEQIGEAIAAETISEAIKGKSSLCSDTLHAPSTSSSIEKVEPVVMKVTPRNNIGRNQICPCGSEKKYKKCCLLKREYIPGA